MWTHPFQSIPTIIDRRREWILGRHSVVDIDKNGVERSNHVSAKPNSHLQVAQHETTTVIVHDQWASLPIRFGGRVDANWDFSAVAHRNLAVNHLDMIRCWSR